MHDRRTIELFGAVTTNAVRACPEAYRREAPSLLRPAIEIAFETPACDRLHASFSRAATTIARSLRALRSTSTSRSAMGAFRPSRASSMWRLRIFRCSSVIAASPGCVTAGKSSTGAPAIAPAERRP